MFLAFLLGSVGTIIGTLVSFLMFGSQLHEAHIICASLCASYIGGSVNFSSVVQTLGGSPGIIASAMTADNVAMAGYIGILMLLSKKTTHSQQKNAGDMVCAQLPPSAKSMSFSTAASALSCAIGSSMARSVSQPSLMLAFSAVIASSIVPILRMLGHILKKDAFSRPEFLFSGSVNLASVLMTLFFCTIGAQAGDVSSILGSGMLFAFISVQLIIQLGVTLFLGRIFSIPLPYVLIASNANVGGPGTAAAMCAAVGWEDLIAPALLVGTFGYACGTSIGLFMAKILHFLMIQ